MILAMVDTMCYEGVDHAFTAIQSFATKPMHAYELYTLITIDIKHNLDTPSIGRPAATDHRIPFINDISALQSTDVRMNHDNNSA